jgi:alpha-L-fucosidase 2
VTLPDEGIQRHYELSQYFYGSASRGSAPIALQGVWTADEGGLPPWKGDYHHDLNTQLTYWPYLAAGHLDEGLCFLDWLWSLLPAAREFAGRFFSAPGACLPGVSSLSGQPLGGWAQYSFAPANSAWLAQAFYLHWRHTMDAGFLAERAYPWCAEVGKFVETILEPDATGKLKLPVSASPEIHDNSPAAWLPPNTNFDLALLRWLFGALWEMAGALGKADDAERWRSILDRLDDLHVYGQDGPLKVCASELLRESHRHHSHLMAIHPLGLLHVDQGERSRRIIENCLQQIDALGTGNWTGYSFSWMACIAARARQANRALNMLELYLKGFVSRNGFHLNGDFKNLGLSQFKYRPFTLEGNFAAAQAVHEMLVQVTDGVLHLFPATPALWTEVSFDRLRVDGGFLVSAQRLRGQTISICVEAPRGGTLRLRNSLSPRARWSRKPSRTDAELEWDLAPGQEVQGMIPKPA